MGKDLLEQTTDLLAKKPLQENSKDIQSTNVANSKSKNETAASTPEEEKGALDTSSDDSATKLSKNVSSKKTVREEADDKSDDVELTEEELEELLDEESDEDIELTEEELEELLDEESDEDSDDEEDLSEEDLSEEDLTERSTKSEVEFNYGKDYYKLGAKARKARRKDIDAKLRARAKAAQVRANIKSGSYAASVTPSAYKESSEELDSKLTTKTKESLESVANIFADDSSLTEDFKTKASALFEASLSEGIAANTKLIKEFYENQFNEKVNECVDSLNEQIDSYLQYVVNEWVKENKLAIESGIKSEISESFMTGLKELFETHYIEVPESKVDLVEELSEAIVSLEEKLNKSLFENSKLNSKLTEQNKLSIINDVVDGLSDVQTDRFVNLVENITYSDGKSYRNKLLAIKERFLEKTSSKQPNTVDETEPEKTLVEQKQNISKTVGSMKDYISVLEKQISQ